MVSPLLLFISKISPRHRLRVYFLRFFINLRSARFVGLRWMTSPSGIISFGINAIGVRETLEAVTTTVGTTVEDSMSS